LDNARTCLVGRDEKDRREITARWTITAKLTIHSASQIGSHESDWCDQTFARNSEGKPILQGSTLAGALRSALSDHMEGYLKEEHSEARNIFGGWEDDKQDDGHESPVIVFDSVAESIAESSIRDGVVIDPTSGTAVDKGKYDRELAMPGIVFPLRLDVIITEKQDGNNENKVLSMLSTALESLAGGKILFGARKSRGMGQCNATDFRAVRYDMTSADGWISYSKSDYVNPTAHIPKGQQINDALSAAWSEYIAQKYDDCRNSLKIHFDLEVDGTLLIRSPGRNATDADAIHLTEQGKAILSGTSIAGAIRSHANRLLRTIEKDTMLEGLFGPMPKEVERQGSRASRVLITESIITGGSSYRQSRVKIDRFTGGAIDTALFDEQPSIGGKVSFDVILINPNDSEIGLLLLVARDLSCGFLPLGGGASIGRGVLKGDFKVAALNGEGDWRNIADDTLNNYVKALYEEVKSD
jgi:CRISPR/Cas system CSM-associated protein Csm3 (group 7 of RAMP superfamily)